MGEEKSRRKSVMSRSIKLGHCVCDPLQPCPCEVFKQHNVCQCAGEKLPRKEGDAALTKHVHKAGCASKIGQADLQRIVGKLPEPDDANVLLGTAAGDDAGIYRLGADTALVQTVDVFTPCVDDAYTFGQIAAANSVSDVYAMGGRPISALSIIGFPIDDLDGEIMERLLLGGIEKLNEAGCSLIGGHSINDKEVKLGFAVTGLIDPDAVVQRDRARPGDKLVLTKPLGMGMISFAAQIDRVQPEWMEQIGAAMATLNKDAAELMVECGAHACTDITGYGLAGHLVEMVRRSEVEARLDFAGLPVFGATELCLNEEILSGAVERNQEYAMGWVKVDEGLPRGNLPILYDPQTSGGLLLALPREKTDEYIERMHARGHAATSLVGEIVAREGGAREGGIRVVNTELANFIA